MLGLDHFVYQRGCAGKAHSPLLPAGGHRQATKQMGLSGAAVAYKDHGLRFRDVIAFSQFVNLLGRDLGIAREVALLQSLQAEQTGLANARSVSRCSRSSSSACNSASR